jgi:hypothetical protein
LYRSWGIACAEVVNELNLPKEMISCHPSNLSLPDHVDCFVALNGSPGCLEFSYHLAILSHHQPTTLNVATHPFGWTTAGSGHWKEMVGTRRLELLTSTVSKTPFSRLENLS